MNKISDFFAHAKPHLVAFVYSTMFWFIPFALVFYYAPSTTPASSSAEIKLELNQIIQDNIKKSVNSLPQKITFNAIKSEPLDLSVTNSIFVYGTFLNNEGEICRFLNIFEPKSPNLFDKIAGRMGFYESKSFTYVNVEDSEDALLPESIEIKDIDQDGNKEILVHVKSTWADASSRGIFILKKGFDDEWKLLSLHSLSKTLSNFLSSKTETERLETQKPLKSPNVFFGDLKRKDVDTKRIMKKMAGYGIYEDLWEVNHNGDKMEITMIRNGGIIKEFKHPYKNNFQLGIAVDIDDDRAVQGNHQVMISFVKIGNDDLETDIFWNWGYPMISVVPTKISDIDLSEFWKIGISSHEISNSFFGYTEFEKVVAK